MKTDDLSTLPRDISIEILLKLPDWRDGSTPGPEPVFFAHLTHTSTAGTRLVMPLPVSSGHCFASHEDSVAASPEGHLRKLLERIQVALLPLCSKPELPDP